MKKVRFLKSCTGAPWYRASYEGFVNDVPDDVADAMSAAGVVQILETKAPAKEEAPQTGASPKRRAKKRKA